MTKFKKIDWLNHVLEFIVVIIGILIAFQLNTCREGKKEQQLVKRHLESVISETEFNQSMVLSTKTNAEKLLAQIDSLETYIAAGEDLQKVNNLALSLLSLDYVYVKKNAYNSLVETGDIRFIKDFQLQNDIVSLYEYYIWLEGIDTSSRDTHGKQYFPYVVNNFDLTTYQPQPLEIYNSKEFKNYLSVYRFSMNYRLQKQNDVLEVMDNFLTNYKDN